MRRKPGRTALALTALMTIGLAGAVSAAAGTHDGRAERRDRGSSVVVDDDGGKAFIVRPGASGPRSVRYHGGAVVAEARRVTIFLGSEWAEPANRELEPALADLEAAGFGPDAEYLLRLAGATLAQPAAASYEELADIGRDTTVRDLDVQAMLERRLADGSLEAPRENLIYVVFLAPGLSSALGVHRGGRDYLAYHNYFHASTGEVHYAVVPFAREETRDAAGRAFVDAVVNPSGQGWY